MYVLNVKKIFIMIKVSIIVCREKLFPNVYNMMIIRINVINANLGIDCLKTICSVWKILVEFNTASNIRVKMSAKFVDLDNI